MKSKTTDIPLTATPEGDIPAAPDLAAPKPVRRRRTAKAPAVDTVNEAGAAADRAEPDGAVPDNVAAPGGEAAVEVTVDVTAEPAAPPKRRRRKAAPAEAVEAAEPAATDLPAAPEKSEVFRAVSAPDSIAAVPAVAEPIAAAYRPEAEPRPEVAAGRDAPSDHAPEVSVRESETAAAETAFVEAPAGRAEAAEPGEPATGDRSGRRRGRRDRKRGQRADQPADGAPATERAPLAAPNESASTPSLAAEADAEGDGDEPAAARPPRAEPTDVNEVFAKVLVGTFDAECEPAEEEAPYKRVLAPEPDAPKLHKVLAQAGVGSRRDMEQLILEGRITVNGEPAHIGQRISYGDQIKVSGKPVKVRIAPPPARVIAYHKPVGEVVTYHDPENRPTVFRRLPRLPQGKWQSVGRLDINTEGLLLFTNSGDLANQLTHPRFGVEREYAVRVLGSLDEYHREELLDGVDIDGQEASFRSIEDGGGEGANRWYRVVITEGRNREVRRMFEAVGLTVSRLIRIRYGNVVLPRGLKRGVWVDLDESDVRAIRRLAGGDDFRPQQNGKPGAGRNNGNGKNGRDRPRNNGNNNQNQANRGPRDDRNSDFDADHGPIPNPLEQTFDKRFVQKPRPLGGFGGPFGGGGFGPGGSNARGDAPRKGGPKQPDPMQTSVGYIGADAFHRKGNRGGNRGGGGGGGGGGFGGGFGGGGGGRRGR